MAGSANTVRTEAAKDTVYAKWVEFCHSLGHSSTLNLVESKEDKLCYLLVFGLRY